MRKDRGPSHGEVEKVLRILNDRIFSVIEDTVPSRNEIPPKAGFEDSQCIRLGDVEKRIEIVYLLITLVATHRG